MGDEFNLAGGGSKYFNNGDLVWDKKKFYITLSVVLITVFIATVVWVIINPIIKSSWGLDEEKTISIKTENGYTLYHTGNRQACVQVNGEDKRIKITFLVNGESSSGYVEKENLPSNEIRTFCYIVGGEPDKVIVETIVIQDSYVNNN